MLVIKLCLLVIKMLLIYWGGKNPHLFVHLLTALTNQTTKLTKSSGAALCLEEQENWSLLNIHFQETFTLYHFSSLNQFFKSFFILHTLVLKTRPCKYLLLGIDSLTSRLLALVKLLKHKYLKFSICILRLVYVSCELKLSAFLWFIFIFERYLLTCSIKKIKKKPVKPFTVLLDAAVVVCNSLTSGLHPLRRAVWNSSVTAFIIITSAVGKFILIAISNQSAPISVQANIACLIFQKWLWVVRVFIGTTLIHTTGSSLWGYNTSWTAQLYESEKHKGRHEEQSGNCSLSQP